MSAESNRAVFRALSGQKPRDLWIEIPWKGSPVRTWNEMRRMYDLETAIHPRGNCDGKGPCAVYLAKLKTVVPSMTIFKVGVTWNVKSRTLEHGACPLLRVDSCTSIQCTSRRAALSVETSFLASSASAGFWIRGEWIAGCNKSRSRLATDKNGPRWMFLHDRESYCDGDALVADPTSMEVVNG